MTDPWHGSPGHFSARRFDMDNGDTALFAWDTDDSIAYWIGNTETPPALWRTDKFSFGEVPFPIARWAQREWIAELERDEPWCNDYPYLTWFFLPVLCSKDGRDTTRRFFREHAAGFYDTSRDTALQFYETFLRKGTMDRFRYQMASKLGTSTSFDSTRMSATMSEFTVAKLLTDAGYSITPEIEVITGHYLDFRAKNDNRNVLVEVTRPTPPRRRKVDSPLRAVRESVRTKTADQLKKHGGGAILFVDCSSFPPNHWRNIVTNQPEVNHRPAIVFRITPPETIEAYRLGSVPLRLPAITFFN